MKNEYEIVPYRDYFKVLINGKFYCSADTWEEAEEDVRLHQKQARKQITLDDMLIMHLWG